MSERTREPDRAAPAKAGKASGSSQTAQRKRPSQGQKSVEKGEPEKKTGTSAPKRRPTQGQGTGKPASGKKPASAGEYKKPASKKTSVSSDNRSKKTTDRTRRPPEKNRMEDEERMSNRDIERARRRQERIKRVRRQKIIMTVSITVIVLCLLTILLIFLSPARCIMSLSRGDKYARNGEYDKALEAYQEALEINEKSVRAYRGAAGCLRMTEQITEAEQILYTGYEKTRDKGILRYYNKLLINEAVEDVNAGNCTQATLDKLNRVLLNDPQNPDALEIKDICTQRMSAGEPQDTGQEQ